jgi:hypothetical protein
LKWCGLLLLFLLSVVDICSWSSTTASRSIGMAGALRVCFLPPHPLPPPPPLSFLIFSCSSPSSPSWRWHYYIALLALFFFAHELWHPAVRKACISRTICGRVFICGNLDSRGIY